MVVIRVDTKDGPEMYTDEDELHRLRPSMERLNHAMVVQYGLDAAGVYTAIDELYRDK